MLHANEESRNAIPEVVGVLANGLAAMVCQFEPILKELSSSLEPLIRSLDTAAPRVQAIAHEIAHEMAKLDTAESLLERGWVPNHTTPFGLVSECGDDSAGLQTSLLAYYTDNWGEVRERLETRLFYHDIDDEAKATFREALDAHEAGLYRSVSRVLFPEFERVFRAVLFGGCAGHISYQDFVRKLCDEGANLELGDFLIAGIQDMVLFQYLIEGVSNVGASSEDSRSGTPHYGPGLAVGIGKKNVEQAKRSPIPTRHGVAHGLVTYSSRQSSLNAIFIADYVFSVLFEASRRRPPDSNVGDGPSRA